MSRIFVWVLVLATVAWPLDRVSAAAPKTSASAQVPLNRGELSYALGYEAGLDLGQRTPNVDLPTVLRGVQDGYQRKKPAYSPQAMQQVLHELERQLLATARSHYIKLAAANLDKARAFFTENGKKPGVVTLPSGVQYKVLDAAKGGASPTLTSEVTLQFSGQFLGGTVFANTEDRGKSVVFPVKYMIPGWREIITRMHVGD
ncbi:MAG TPA: FKBP-type peptidyl-prolyl cis-trans isomerase N-terminal domain-containing protein, partial [Rhodanobacteraceae bacterium]